MKIAQSNILPAALRMYNNLVPKITLVVGKMGTKFTNCKTEMLKPASAASVAGVKKSQLV